MLDPVHVLERKFHFRDTLSLFLSPFSATDAPAVTFILLWMKVAKALHKLWIKICCWWRWPIVKSILDSHKPEVAVHTTECAAHQENLCLVYVVPDNRMSTCCDCHPSLLFPLLPGQCKHKKAALKQSGSEPELMLCLSLSTYMSTSLLPHEQGVLRVSGRAGATGSSMSWLSPRMIRGPRRAVPL